MILFKNVHVYAPEDLGLQDVLISGDKIIRIAKDIDARGLPVDVNDCDGATMIPGLIDNHVHITGGGGEAGYASKVPPLGLTDFTRAGVTTAIGLLGTDGFSRSMKELISKAKGLKQEGLNVYVLSGSYQMPLKTIFDDIEDDMLFIEEIIGAGEIAISDHRSTAPKHEELKRLIKQVHVGGMLSNKGGTLNVHVGSGSSALKPLTDLLDDELPVKKIVPTHINRSQALLDAGIDYALHHDGNIDFTAYPAKHPLGASSALKYAIKKGVRVEQITISSDGGGSLPTFDHQGKLLKMGVGKMDALIHTLRDAYAQGIAFEDALKPLTSNVADIYHLRYKGRIQEGYDADIIVLDGKMNIRDLYIRAKPFIKNYDTVKKGMFE